MTTKRPWVGPALGSALALAASGAAALPAARVRAGTGPLSAQSVGVARAARPNIVLIMADDLDIDLGTMASAYTPNIHRLIADAGVTLDDYYVTDSLCCPSRTTYLRGQYTHNHGVYTNAGDTGGYAQLRARDLESSTLATWLQAAGYRTGLFGKYINGYPLDDDPTHIPPGWSEWVSPAAGNAYGSYNYTLNDNGTLVPHGRAPEDYITDVLAAKADDFIARAAAAAAPFFAFVVPYAPHNPAEPAPRHAALFPDLQVPRTGAYNEADVSDKPAVIAALPPLTARQMTTGDDLYRQRVQSMQAVDELVARLVATLDASGDLANTVVLFTSDNGFHIGQHRLPRGKTTAYEEDIHVPFYARGPGIPAGTTLTGTLVGNVDIAPTLAELAGAAVPSFVDGRSFASYLTGDRAAGAWRQGYLIEQYPFVDERGAAAPDAARIGLLEPPDGDGEGPFDRSHVTHAAADAPTATYIALRTMTHTFIAHENGETELYNNIADPYQLANIAATVDQDLLVESLSTYARALHACRGPSCRSIEESPIGMVIDGGTPTVSPTALPTPTPTSTARYDHVWLPIAHNAAAPTDPLPGSRETALAQTSPRATRTPPGTPLKPTPSPSPTTATNIPPPLSAAACPQTAAYNAAADGVSLYVTRDGVPVCADYPNGGAPDEPHALASGTKSFSGVMAAAAIEDGILTGWDEVVADTVTEWQGDPRKSLITVRHLLSLTSGLDAGTVGNVPTYAEAIAAPANHDPGTTFEYGPLPYQAFGELMRRKLAGRYADPLAYLDARILEPIGARYDAWRRGTDGMPRLPSGAQLTAAEWATFGELIRQHGRWDGRPLVRQDLLAECFIGSDVRPTYGLTWWLLTDLDRPAPGKPARVVAAKGAGIQRLYVLDAYGIVAVRQTGSQLDSAAGDARFSDAAFLGRLLADLGVAP